jgi:hypothetical protein
VRIGVALAATVATLAVVALVCAAACVTYPAGTDTDAASDSGASVDGPVAVRIDAGSLGFCADLAAGQGIDAGYVCDDFDGGYAPLIWSQDIVSPLDASAATSVSFDKGIYTVTLASGPGHAYRFLSRTKTTSGSKLRVGAELTLSDSDPKTTQVVLNTSILKSGTGLYGSVTLVRSDDGAAWSVLRQATEVYPDGGQVGSQDPIQTVKSNDPIRILLDYVEDGATKRLSVNCTVISSMGRSVGSPFTATAASYRDAALTINFGIDRYNTDAAVTTSFDTFYASF